MARRAGGIAITKKPNLCRFGFCHLLSGAGGVGTVAYQAKAFCGILTHLVFQDLA